jgi:hypothetical protein
MARFRNTARAPRNTAPMWKKLAVLFSAPLALIVVNSLFHINKLNFFVTLVLVVAVVAAAVWGTAKLLGVHLSLRSWD